MFGAGTVGMLCAAVCAVITGAAEVVLADVNTSRLTFAETWLREKLDHKHVSTCHLERGMSTEHVVDKIQSQISPQAVDIVIEATGHPDCVRSGFSVLRKGGLHIHTGLGPETMHNFPIMLLSEKELCLRGCLRYTRKTFELALGILARHGLGKGLQDMITDEYPFEQAVEAWESTAQGDGIKNIIRTLENRKESSDGLHLTSSRNHPLETRFIHASALRSHSELSVSLRCQLGLVDCHPSEKY